MRKIWNKGHRIRASDKHLVYHFSIGTLLFVFVAVLLLLNMKQLMRTDWEHFSLLENGLTLSPYNFIAKALHAVINFVVVFVLSASFIAYAPDYIKKINEFSSDISTACLRPLYDEYGNLYIAVDMELKGRIREAMIKKMRAFEVNIK